MLAGSEWRYYPNNVNKYALATSYAPVTSSENVAIFGPSKLTINGHDANTAADGGATADGTMCIFKGYGGSPKVTVAYAKPMSKYFVPFISRTQGLAMIDLVSGTFHENKGTGSFTELIESPS